MPKYCCVPGCTNKRGHLFPTSKAMLMRWRVAINRGTPNRKCLWQPNLNHDVVCHDHFLDSDYIVGRKRRTLKPNAVPSIFGYGKKRKPRRTQRSLSERQESWIGSEAVVMEDCSDKCLYMPKLTIHNFTLQRAAQLCPVPNMLFHGSLN